MYQHAYKNTVDIFLIYVYTYVVFFLPSSPHDVPILYYARAYIYIDFLRNLLYILGKMKKKNGLYVKEISLYMRSPALGIRGRCHAETATAHYIARSQRCAFVRGGARCDARHRGRVRVW